MNILKIKEKSLIVHSMWPISLRNYQSWNSAFKEFWLLSTRSISSNTVNTTKYYTFIHFLIFTNFFFLFSEHCEVNESTSTSALYINENDSSSNPQGKVRLPWLPKALQSSTISDSDEVHWLRSRNVEISAEFLRIL